MQIAIDPSEFTAVIQAAVEAAFQRVSLAQSQPAEPLLMTIRQAAKVLNLSESTLFKLTAAEEIAAVRIGTAVRYAPDDLRAWIERSKGVSQ